MEIIAKGQLHHHFWGDYLATVALSFDTAVAADAAAVVLGEPWKRHPSTKVHGVTWRGGREALDKLKEKFRGKGFALTIDRCSWAHCRDNCADAEIDGLPHSVDVGPRFTLAIECADPRQISLL